MSAATEFPPIVHIPTAARRAPVGRGATVRRGPAAGRREHLRVVGSGDVSCLTAVSPAPASSAVHLTRRGWALVLTVASVVAAVLLWIGYASQPPTSAPGPVAGLPAQVVVAPGDTLWSIASAVAPGRDPRAVVYDLQQRNHLGSAALVPGEVLRVS